MAKRVKGEEEEKGGLIDLREIKKALDSAENQIRHIRHLIFKQEYQNKASRLKDEGKVTEGVFDGEAMIGANGKKYPVPPNYASKSKLLPGDELTLTIKEDGLFVFKQINPVKRKRVVGRLEEAGGRFFATIEGQNYQISPACVSFFKADVGDKVTLLVPKEKESEWGVMENVISR